MLYISSQDRFALITNPQNDIKIEKNRRDDRFGDPGKSKRKCDHCGKAGHCLKLHDLTKAVVVDVQVLRNLIFI